MTALLAAEALHVTLPDRARKRPFRAAPNIPILTASTSPSAPARRLASSANPAPARPRSAARWCGCWPHRRAHPLRRPGHHPRNEATLRPLRGRMTMIFQNPLSSLNPRRTIAASVAAPLVARGESKRGPRPSPPWNAPGCRRRLPTATRTSSPAASASASASRAPSSPTRPSSWPTRSSRAWTSPPRRRSSICCAGCGATWASHSPSSPTTCRWCAVLCERVVVMHQGRIVETGATEAVSPPRSTPTRAAAVRHPLPEIDRGWLDAEAEEMPTTRSSKSASKALTTRWPRRGAARNGSNLRQPDRGGITPAPASCGARCGVRIPVMAMVRPRGGDFLYSDLEYASMLDDAASPRPEPPASCSAA